MESAQYAGYLFPMGPFFALGHLLGVSDWLVDRLWLGLLLAVGCWGLVRLVEVLGAVTSRSGARSSSRSRSTSARSAAAVAIPHSHTLAVTSTVATENSARAGIQARWSPAPIERAATAIRKTPRERSIMNFSIDLFITPFDAKTNPVLTGFLSAAI